MNPNKYNQRDTILVIAPYPARSTTHTGGGIASYSKNTILAIKKANPTQKIVVLANIIDEPETYLENDILVVRCWDRNPGLYLQLLRQINKYSQAKKVLFEFEFAAYGDFLTTSLIPLLLTYLRLTGKSITTVLHQVVADLKQLGQHVGLSHKPKSLNIFNRGLHLFYQIIALLSNQVITLEEPLAKKLKAITGRTNIVTIPHGLYPKKAINRHQALTHLNLNSKNLYVLAFGYLSHYKGSDLIVKAFKRPIKIGGKTVKLILAGGESPTQGQKNHYRGFYKRLYDAIDNNENIIHTGFVPETRIKSYFSAADLVVFPYRTFMSASGPLSLAASYQKPFLASQPLSIYNPDFVETSAEDFRRAVIDSLKSKKHLENLRQNSKSLGVKRNFDIQGQIYLNLISRSRSVKLDLWPKTSPNSDIAPSFARS